MNVPLIVIGLDSADPVLLDDWLARGCLPRLARLREQGAYVALQGPDLYLSEQAWTLVMTGCESGRTGYWSRWKFDASRYDVRDTGPYDFAACPPFYTLCPSRRCAIFDVPQSVVQDEVDGVQVVAWGARSARTGVASRPPDLIEELTRTHGAHPAFDRDHASHWNPLAITWLQRALAAGIDRRSAICRDLLSRQPWDLFFTVFGETHSAGHFFWHLSQEHPIRPAGGLRRDPLLATFQAIDRSVADILAARPEAAVLLFSPEGMAANTVDLPSTVFLPELLHRLSFGQPGLAAGPGSDNPGASIARPWAIGWHRELYALRADTHPLRRRLRRWLPMEITGWWEDRHAPGPGPSLPTRFGTLFHQPPVWYTPRWPEMPCFALPSISQGYIRLNVRGRERCGRIEPGEYVRFCDELDGHLRALRCGRTGRPLVTRIVRTRQSALENGPGVPDADLVVFYDERPTDVVVSPTFGRIGPVPYARTGGHVNRGFALVRAPGVSPGSRLPDAHVRDLAPTILSLLGVEVPSHMSGRALTGPVPAAAAEAAHPC